MDEGVWRAPPFTVVAKQVLIMPLQSAMQSMQSEPAFILYACLLCISFFWVPARRMTIGSHMRRTRGGQTMTATTHGTQITTAGVNIGMAGLFSIDMLFPL